ncbi:MAG: Hsp20/alpha crystallin family protein [Pseudomonadales bacterium]|nr:Hsp20/alpha crystallin family protein [Pseudomonadales bacterium]
MATLEQLTHNLKDTFENIAEGWQHLWHKARNSITRFTPFADEQDSDHPLVLRSNRWGVLSAEVRETDKFVEVELEAPGLENSDFDIQVEGDSLSISGNKHYENDRREGHFHITERAYGSFRRVIPLPVRVDQNGASAKYRNGVLKVTLPKSEISGTKKILVD